MSNTQTISMVRNTLLDRVDLGLLGLPKALLLATLATLQVFLVYGDYLTGPWVPFSVFYLFTLYFAVKYLGMTVALVMVLAIVTSKTYIRVTHADVQAHIVWWQIMVQFASSLTTYSFFCYLIKNQIGARARSEWMAYVANKRAGEAEHQLVSISEEVHQRIGRELHDDLGQHLTGIAFKAQILASKLQEQGSEVAAEAKQLTVMLNQAIAKTRGIAHGLYPAELEEQGLSGMLEKFSDYVAATYHVRCTLENDGACNLTDHDVAVHLFRITQEAVSNAIKHGQAAHIRLRLATLEGAYMLEIADDGRGMQKGAEGKGLGLRSMRYRAELIGATLEIGSRSDGGSRVVVTLPQG